MACYINSDKPWLAMVHSDKPWQMLCDDVILIFLYKNTGSLQLWEFITILFSTQTTLAISYKSNKKKRNNITGNVQACTDIFNKCHAHFFVSHGVTMLPLSLPL